MWPCSIEKNKKMLHVLKALCLVMPLISLSSSENNSNVSVDPKGYIVYCPCMGRFGNQADQFLGVLAFAKRIDRILVVPPWVEYRRFQSGTVMVPYSTYFKIEALSSYHRVISMEDFMDKLADQVWPKGERKVFCYTARHGSVEGSCNAKDGNPFGPFWDWFDVDFDESEIFGPLFYDIQSPSNMDGWRTKYPPSTYPVLAFVGAPSAFPMLRFNAKLHRFIKWSDEYDQKADEFIEKNIPSQPFLAIHLRNGIDFQRACEHVKSSPKMFAAEQCIGEGSRYGTTTKEMCFPSTDTILQQVKKEIDISGAKTLFIATDNDSLKAQFEQVLTDVEIVLQNEPADPQLDLAILGRADRFIGNCVSTYTAFAKRERDIQRLPSSFWAFERKKRKEEL